MDKCDKGWHNGDCCCNCVNQFKLSKHPWNKDIGKGPVSEYMGFVCVLNFGDDDRMATFFDREHSYCECHIRKSEKVTETEITPEQIPNKKEIKKIFKDHQLDLDFPVKAEDGSTVVDFKLLYGRYTATEPVALYSFIDIIKKDYSDQYEIKSSGMLSSIDIYKKLDYNPEKLTKNFKSSGSGIEKNGDGLLMPQL